jgi:hypothetical protein
LRLLGVQLLEVTQISQTTHFYSIDKKSDPNL